MAVMEAQPYMLQFLLGQLPPSHSFSASGKKSQHIPANRQLPQWTGFLLRSLAAAVTLTVESRQFLMRTWDQTNHSSYLQK